MFINFFLKLLNRYKIHIITIARSDKNGPVISSKGRETNKYDINLR